ncbi:MAG: HAD family hydrolase [Anaerolineae bacterium]|nr:HAD family hydrolase [Anaerolineae bacterium]MCO5199166.1 HAD family hydrolase [Anaerolineae bacterium]
MYPALFLDRDGVLIENRPNYVRSWDDVDIYAQAVDALAAIHAIPYKVIIVTNQSGIGRGLIPASMVESINCRLVAAIEAAGGRIDAVYVCPHAPQAGCDCRKPRSGLLLRAAADHAIDLKRSIMIGDALTDVAAGRAAEVSQSILLRSGRGREQLQLPGAIALQPFPVYDDLASALHALFDGVWIGGSSFDQIGNNE